MFQGIVVSKPQISSQNQRWFDPETRRAQQGPGDKNSLSKSNVKWGTFSY